MNSPAPPTAEVKELLIVSVTPQNLERADLSCPPNAARPPASSPAGEVGPEPSGDAGGWFSENFTSIKQAQSSNPWWQDNALIIEKGLVMKPSKFSRRMLDLRYERAREVLGKGLFAVRGGIIECWPINSSKPYIIEFYGNKIETIRERESRKSFYRPRVSAQSLEKLRPGSFAVHADHGIGIFRGNASKGQVDQIDESSRSELGLGENATVLPSEAIDQLHQAKRLTNYFVVEYAPARKGGPPDLLYVPADQKDRIMPYIGFETPRIHRLGGNIWQTAKRKVKEETEKLARELLSLYAKRHIAERTPHFGDTSLEEALRAAFPYQETEDQLRAEEDILKDLSQSRPMDRILCGDVGFGKTEIALRAAMRVIVSGKQVALLAPTTVLAAQHDKTFRERLQDLPVRVSMLSRIASRREEKHILSDLENGSMDCVIGTHRILSPDVKFKNLGLVIIDEEQRFGVRQKERLKSIRSEIDVLSLSATPIPRTLSFTLARLRDISIIATPPPERLPISTIVLPYSARLIKTALEFELERGGQVYFLHNRIETIGDARKKIERMIRTMPKKILRHAKIGILHGRMPEKELIRAMNQFRDGTLSILIATTIIENGLDISSANTLIVDDATRLGLAEAHQLRGRIGRSNVRAFAYFLYKPRHLTQKAAERLEALKEYAELGSGYEIALRDLEIRGAGNILGKEQSGAINRVGLNLYYQMLGEAIEELRSG